jgi:hypothetical protein
MAKLWMQNVRKGMEKRGTKGVFSAAAHRAGMSTSAFAHKHEHSPGKIGKRARLALVFAHAARHKH